MENVGFDPEVIHFNVHTAKYNHVLKTNKGAKLTVARPYADFHVFAIEWGPEKLDFFVDVTKTFTYQREDRRRGVALRQAPVPDPQRRGRRRLGRREGCRRLQLPPADGGRLRPPLPEAWYKLVSAAGPFPATGDLRVARPGSEPGPPRRLQRMRSKVPTGRPAEPFRSASPFGLIDRIGEVTSPLVALSTLVILGS
jgi:hypothetical protein